MIPRSRFLVALVAGIVLGASLLPVLACNAVGLGPTPPITSAMLDAGAAANDVADGAADAQTGAFFACTFDSDCVTVRKNGCCDNGYLDAVNAASVDAYKASFRCTTKQVCPMFHVVDTRVVHCTRDTHKCELVRPDGGHELPTPP